MACPSVVCGCCLIEDGEPDSERIYFAIDGCKAFSTDQLLGTCGVLEHVDKRGLTLCDPVDCSLPGFSIYEIFQARILEWVTVSYSRGSS